MRAERKERIKESLTVVYRAARMVMLLVVAALVAACGVRKAPPYVTVTPVADVFPAIPEVHAMHGVAHVALDVVVDPVSGYPAFEWGTRLGEAPTIRVAPGDTIDMTVHDAMRPFAGRPDDVNVHFHGLTVAPSPPGDEVLMTLAHPGQTLHYRVVIPRDHEPGLYWYHPHAHGEAYYDVTNGMAGAIVVDGMQRHLPALAAMRERVVVLRDVPTGPGFVDDDMPMSGTVATAHRSRRIARSGAGRACRAETGLQPTLNRRVDARIGIRPGERQFFRVVNASAARYYDLSVDGTPLELVALDGVPLDAYPGTPPTRTVQHVLVPPAGRAEFVVSGLDHSTMLRSACVDTGAAGDANPAVVLAHLVDPTTVAGGAAASDAPTLSAEPLRVGAPLPHNVLSRALQPPAARRTIRFTEDDHGFYLDGKVFAMDAPPAIVARSGTVEEWTLTNATDEVHAFHIHQVHFVPLAVDGTAVAPRTWADTVNVPPRR
ncbi:MAG: multicopper oxidase domain-containing protein, partial [Candidatus Eremiobacteraeota bacterium]|nr:multicopper oxidase domain-containing protein [Candidatus Eremiobacteraeota bacterium]